MANVMVKKPNAEKPAIAAAHAWEPFRAVRELMRWDPFMEMAPSLATETSSFAPAFEVKETKEAFVFTADMPGVKESDLDVRLTQNRLSISGKRESEKSDKSETYYAYERSFGSFTRTFTLPEGVNTEAIKATMKDGVLTVELPKLPEQQPKKVEVKGS
jgi:HSP20 family protein